MVIVAGGAGGVGEAESLAEYIRRNAGGAHLQDGVEGKTGQTGCIGGSGEAGLEISIGVGVGRGVWAGIGVRLICQLDEVGIGDVVAAHQQIETDRQGLDGIVLQYFCGETVGGCCIGCA